MSKSYRSYSQRESTMKREDRYCGWEGETAGAMGRKLNKRRAHRAARQVAKQQIAEAL